MKSRDFCFWLQGYFELLNDNDGSLPIFNTVQTQQIKNHLDLVFKHEIDPPMGDVKIQQQLSTIHSGGVPGTVMSDPNILIRC